ncbi:MAG: serine/threonine protein kinase, partial [Chitinivibrionales bacterium]|nr:serine/threonine protein kinase [Chitinivibrionales bacterium]
KIGAGGMATVYRAYDTVLKRSVGLKKVHPYLLDHPETVKRFENEAHAIAAISHENIIKLYDYGRDGSNHFLVIEYIEGWQFLDILKKLGSLPNLVMLEMFLQIFSGLAAAHEKGILHRDIKPANIMIDRSGCVKIMDFGIALLLLNQDTITMTGSFVGSPSYISPEQAQGKKATDKSDIFSAGSLLYECACGRCPFGGDNVHATIYAIVNSIPAAPLTINALLLEDLGGFISRCIDKDPFNRPTAKESVAILEKIGHKLKLNLGKKRIVRMLENQPAYLTHERSELFSALRENARVEYNGKRNVVALRMLSEAKKFGALEPDDEKLYSKLLFKKTNFRRAVSVALGIAVLLCCAGLVTHYVLRAPRGKTVLKSGSAIAKAGAGPINGEKAGLSLTHDSAIKQSTKRRINETAANISPIKPEKSKESNQDAKPVRGQVQNGFLNIKSNPPWTKILIDGSFRGTYPEISLIPLGPGLHQIVLSHEGCSDIIDSLTVNPGDTVARLYTLMRNR